MSNPYLLFNNILADAALSVTDTEENYSIDNIKDYRAYTYWKGDSAGTKYIYIDALAAQECDAFAFIRHNLQDATEVALHSSTDNVSWTERVAGFSPASNLGIMKIFTAAAARYWRITITTASIQAMLAVVFIGKRTEIPLPPDTPYIPYREKLTAKAAKSKGGNLLGTTLQYALLEVDAKFSNLDRDWVIGWGQELYGAHFWAEGGNFKAWWEYARTFRPFFYAWDLDVYPDQVLYLTAREDSVFQTPLSVLNYVDEVVFQMEGIIE